LLFFANTSKGSYIPVPTGGSTSSPELITQSADTAAQFAIIYDGQQLRLENISEAAVSLSGVIDLGEYKEVTVTLDNISLMYTEAGGKFVRATLISAE